MAQHGLHNRRPRTQEHGSSSNTRMAWYNVATTTPESLSMRDHNNCLPQRKPPPPPKEWQCSLPLVFRVMVLLLGAGCMVGSIPYAAWWLVSTTPRMEAYGTHLFSKADKDNKAVAVFYHIYIPPDKGRYGLERTREILQEQLTQVGQAAKAHGTVWTVYYTTTGAVGNHYPKLAITQKWLEQQVCQTHAPFLHCVPNGPHEEIGYENLTLHAMYKYCQSHDTNDRHNNLNNNPLHHHHNSTLHSSSGATRIVIYLHSKGTYHSSGGRNDIWRRALTHAATHGSCLASLTHPSTTKDNNNTQSMCNVCGLQFYPLWTNFYPGNMFAAKCAYVQTLLDPLEEFPWQLSRVVQAVNQSSSSLWTRDLYKFSNPGNTGLDRYASEHWIASHPTVRPCDVQGTQTTLFVERLPFKIPNDNNNSKTSKTVPNQPQWWSDRDVVRAQPAPRTSITDGDWFRLNQTELSRLLLVTNSSWTTTTRPVDAAAAARQTQGRHDGSQRLVESLFDDTTTTTRSWKSNKEEYFLLPGFLFRHYHLYHAYPPPDSWMWTFYPRGMVWKERVYPPPPPHNSNKNNHEKKKTQPKQSAIRPKES